MCGIAGAIGWIDARIDSAVCRMNDTQRHRGPDDEGTWSNVPQPPGEGVHLSFRRLAIIDLSSEGHQPMIDPATGNVIIFNGELYNFRELRRELEREGQQFKSHSDTEVLLKAYGRWGIGALQRLRGMFAFVIWDERRRCALLARDRLGIKPLYMCTINQPDERKTVVFASELRTLLTGDLVERRLNSDAVASYIWNGFVVGPETIVQGVRLLAPGAAAMVSSDGACKLHRYWKLPRYKPARDGVERLEETLRTSVQQHLMSDVPLGVFLSGGIDSSAITALAVETATSRVQTFNLSFDETEYDESVHARAVSHALGTDHTEVRLTQTQFKAQLHEALSGIDQPTFDAINSYFVSRAVREAGITVALAGTGGDELFGGYRSFTEIPRARRVSQALSFLPESVVRLIGLCVARGKVGHFGNVAPQTRWGKLADVLAARGRLVELYQTSYALFTQDFAQELHQDNAIASITHGLPPSRSGELQELIADEEVLHSISMMELSNFIGERLLRDTDAASMAVSLEVRVPLLDHELVEAIASIDTKRRFHPLRSKQLLRDIALSGLDSKLFDRPKRGFGLPIAVWCRQALRVELDAMFADRDHCRSVGLDPEVVARLWRAFEAGAPGIYWSRVWAIFVLLWWCRTYRVTR